MVKKFTANCSFGSNVSPVTLYVGDPVAGTHPLGFQSKWLGESKGGNIPLDIMNSFSKLADISEKTRVSFEELCSYVIEELQENNSIVADSKKASEFSGGKGSSSSKKIEVQPAGDNSDEADEGGSQITAAEDKKANLTAKKTAPKEEKIEMPAKKAVPPAPVKKKPIAKEVPPPPAPIKKEPVAEKVAPPPAPIKKEPVVAKALPPEPVKELPPLPPEEPVVAKKVEKKEVAPIAEADLELPSLEDFPDEIEVSSEKPAAQNDASVENSFDDDFDSELEFPEDDELQDLEIPKEESTIADSEIDKELKSSLDSKSQIDKDIEEDLKHLEEDLDLEDKGSSAAQPEKPLMIKTQEVEEKTISDQLPDVDMTDNLEVQEDDLDLDYGAKLEGNDIDNEFSDMNLDAAVENSEVPEEEIKIHVKDDQEKEAKEEVKEPVIEEPTAEETPEDPIEEKIIEEEPAAEEVKEVPQSLESLVSKGSAPAGGRKKPLKARKPLRNLKNTAAKPDEPNE